MRARRADGYHDLESLVVFARIGDRLSLVPTGALGLSVRGPAAAQSGPLDDNLVLRAARALQRRAPDLRMGAFTLDKRLPAGAGLGGGSSDAAAALRLLARLNAMDASDPRLMAAAQETGSDVPVCLDPRPRVMRGRGDILSEPLDLPVLPAVLVNPGVALATKTVFAALARTQGAPPRDLRENEWRGRSRRDLIEGLGLHANDLELPAAVLAPEIDDVLRRLAAAAGARLVRMSGSGATCFALHETLRSAQAACAALAAAMPSWWVRATMLG